MSENTTAPVEAAPVEPVVEQSESADILGDGGKKALAAEREARKTAEKVAADYKTKLDQIEQASLSDLEKAQQTAKDAQDQLANLTRENLRNSVALTKGVPADLAQFLTGDTEEALAAQADTLLARLNTPTTPKPDLSQGSQNTAVALNSDGLEEALKSKLGIN